MSHELTGIDPDKTENNTTVVSLSPSQSFTIAGDEENLGQTANTSTPKKARHSTSKEYSDSRERSKAEKSIQHHSSRENSGFKDLKELNEFKELEDIDESGRSLDKSDAEESSVDSNEDTKKTTTSNILDEWFLKLFSDPAASTTVLFSSCTTTAAIAYLAHQRKATKLNSLVTIGVITGVLALGAAEYFSVKAYFRKHGQNRKRN